MDADCVGANTPAAVAAAKEEENEGEADERAGSDKGADAAGPVAEADGENAECVFEEGEHVPTAANANAVFDCVGAKIFDAAVEGEEGEADDEQEEGESVRFELLMACGEERGARADTEEATFQNIEKY